MNWRWWCEIFPEWKSGQKEAWEEMSKKGHFHYVLVRGVLIYGGWCTLGMTLLMYLSSEFDAPPGELFFSNAPLFLVAGALYGELTWWGTSKSYDEHFGSRRDISRD